MRCRALVADEPPSICACSLRTSSFRRASKRNLLGVDSDGCRPPQMATTTRPTRSFAMASMSRRFPSRQISSFTGSTGLVPFGGFVGFDALPVSGDFGAPAPVPLGTEGFIESPVLSCLVLSCPLDAVASSVTDSDADCNIRCCFFCSLACRAASVRCRCAIFCSQARVTISATTG